MSKRKAKPGTTPMEQLEQYLFDIVSEFEYVTGVKLSRIDIKHDRPAGFNAKETIDIKVITE